MKSILYVKNHINQTTYIYWYVSRGFMVNICKQKQEK